MYLGKINGAIEGTLMACILNFIAALNGQQWFDNSFGFGAF